MQKIARIFLTLLCLAGWAAVASAAYVVGSRLAPADAADDELTEYMLENGQSVQVFLSKRGFSCYRRSGHWDDKVQWVPASAMYEDYVSFCGRVLQEPLPQRAFGGEMSRLGWNDSGGSRKRTSVGYVYGVFCDGKIDYALKI